MKRTFSLCLVAILCGCLPCTAAKRTPGQTSPLITHNQEHWIAVLKSEANREEKARACRELSVLGTKAAIPTLVGLLSDPELSHMALYALETIPDNGVEKALTEQLRGLSGRQLTGVITSLGVRKYSKAVKPVSRLLQDTDPAVAQAAARALGSIGTPEAGKALRGALSSTKSPNLFAVYEGSLRCAETLARDGKAKDSRSLYEELSKKQDLPDHVRAAVTYATILSARKGDLAIFKSSLMDENREVFGAAVQASMQIPGADVTRTVEICLLKSPNGRQIVLVQALGLRRSPEAVPGLAKLARESDQKATRIAALRALASVGTPSALEALVEFVPNADEALSRAALDGLAGISSPEADAVALKLMNSVDTAQKIVGIDLVGRRRMHSAVPSLLTLLKSPNAEVRSAAVKPFSDLAGAAEIQPLIAFLLQTKDRQQLEMAADALSSICIRAGKPEGMIHQVVKGLDKAEPVQSEALFKALCSIAGPGALSAVSKSTANADTEVRRAAIRALADWPDASAAPHLLELVNAASSPAEHTLAFRGYIRLTQNSGKSPDEKLQMLAAAGKAAATSDDTVLLLGGLGDIPSVGALQLARSYLSKENSAEDAAAAILRITSQLDAKLKADMEPALKEVLKCAKSEAVLDKARKRMEQLGIAIE